MGMETKYTALVQSTGLDRQTIHNALSYVHYWEKNGKTRAGAAKEAIRINGLNSGEADILLRSIHVAPSEVL